MDQASIQLQYIFSHKFLVNVEPHTYQSKQVPGGYIISNEGEGTKPMSHAKIFPPLCWLDIVCNFLSMLNHIHINQNRYQVVILLATRVREPYLCHMRKFSRHFVGWILCQTVFNFLSKFSDCFVSN